MSGLRRDGAPPPVRHVHLGLGSFFRAHQAWYTHCAPDARRWGVAAFTGRGSSGLAAALAAQDGLYTLVTRAADGDGFETVASVARALSAADHTAWLRYLADPQVQVVTTTVTEAGYPRGADGGLDADLPQVRADAAALREDPLAPTGTVPGRLVAGLAARRRSGAGPLTLVPCDNLPDNGAVLARVVREFAGLVDPGMLGWLDAHTAYAATVVDRITPAPTGEDRAAVEAATGVRDRAPVVTEPFSEWVIGGGFAADRPRWEDAGAVLTADVAPFEERKLWLLNGAHSLLAYAAPARGHATVPDAVADPVCRAWLEQWWDEAARHLRPPAEDAGAYRAVLLERFANRRMSDWLDRIAADGSQKLPVRILPVLRRERAAGRMPRGAVRALAAWVRHLRSGSPVADPRAADLRARAAGPLPEGARAVLAALDPALAADDALVEEATALAGQLTRE